MKNIFKEFLFARHVLVNDTAQSENTFETLFSLANLFGVKIRNGQNLATTEHVQFVANQIGQNVPLAFYRNFPQSVLSLTKEQLLFDQLVHYAVTYGFGNFDNPGHSLFERDFERIAFKEEVPVKVFDIVDADQAVKLLLDAVTDMLDSSRPLSLTSYQVVLECVKDYDYKITTCASKNTAIKLLVDLRDVSIAKLLSLADVLKVVEHIDYLQGNCDIKKLCLKNADRKFLTAVLDYVLQNGNCNVNHCYERKAIWCGFLHHIHYKPKTPQAVEFVNAMRQKGNKSAYSQFEKLVAEGDIQGATDCLKQFKGDNALLRNLNYLLSRCKNARQVNYVLDSINSNNVLVLLQLCLSYSLPDKTNIPRCFRFLRFNKVVVHDETKEEVARRKSVLSGALRQKIAKRIQKLLKQKLKNKVGKVFIADQMKNMALPLQQGASMGGLGALATGSRLDLPECKKIRAFTYWERVNDIDLSAIGLGEDGEMQEFSWRTMFGEQCSEITYSGDQTSGFNGGSEYFDVNLKLFAKKHPQLRYLVFCNNVYSGVDYSQILCKAGYMLRDKNDSGKVFEPKTVQTSFKVDCDSTYACMFALDLTAHQLVWLNCAMQTRALVAGTTSFGFLFDHFAHVDVLNVYDFFKMMATKLVDSPEKADLIVSNDLSDEREGIPTIHSYDFEKITKYFE